MYTIYDLARRVVVAIIERERERERERETSAAVVDIVAFFLKGQSYQITGMPPPEGGAAPM